MDRTVTQIIGESYKDWNWGDTIFISTQTGSGKTYFCFRTLLRYYTELEKTEIQNEPARQRKEYRDQLEELCFRCNCNPAMPLDRLSINIPPRRSRKILYLVNRKVLKEQLLEDKKYLSAEEKGMVDIRTYQEIESEILHNKAPIINPSMYGCVVCDECHYFLADSNFNTNTILSLNYILDYFRLGIKIFMSATIDAVQRYIEQRLKDQNDYMGTTEIYKFPCGKKPDYTKKITSRRHEIHYYSDGRTYDYLNIKIINSKNDIFDIITQNEKGKWLVFVDKISYGEKLKTQLEEALKEANRAHFVAMFTSDYENDMVMLKEFRHIVTNNQFYVNVLISTSVMDNGVSLKDEDLNNIIIIADTQEEFIQMLGRRREDGNTVNLYILKQNSGHFKNRIQYVKEAYNIASEYLAEFIHRVKNPAAAPPIKNVDYNAVEGELIGYKQKVMLDKIMAHEDPKECFGDVIKSFYMWNGIILLNLLSEENMKNLIEYYNEIMADFQIKGEFAFVERQLRWLGKSEQEIAMFIKNYKLTNLERVQNALDDLVEKGEALSKTEVIEFKISIKNELANLLSSLLEDDAIDKDQVGKYLDLLKKSDRPISQPFMKFLSDNYDLPYKLNTKGGNYYFSTLE